MIYYISGVLFNIVVFSTFLIVDDKQETSKEIQRVALFAFLTILSWSAWFSILFVDKFILERIGK